MEDAGIPVNSLPFQHDVAEPLLLGATQEPVTFEQVIKGCQFRVSQIIPPRNAAR